MERLYGTNTQCLKYVFNVIRESESQCYIEDKDTGWKFTYDKATSKIIKADSKSYEFVFKEGKFFISENESEVREMARIYEIEGFERELENLEDHIPKIQDDLSKLHLITTPDKELKDLKLDDIVIVISDKKDPIEGRVSGRWKDMDGDDFYIEITCSELSIYGRTVLRDSINENYYVEWDTDYDGSRYYDVFLSKDDYDKWVNNENYNKVSKVLTGRIRRKSEITKMLEKLKSNK